MPSMAASDSDQPSRAGLPWRDWFLHSSYRMAVHPPSSGGSMAYSRPGMPSKALPRARASREMGAPGKTR